MANNEVTTILVIDQGTSSSRALLFEPSGCLIAQAQTPIKTLYPQSGWVEQDAEKLFLTTLACCKKVLKKTDCPPSALAITNQRETTIVWQRSTGKPLYPAIVWQDKRTQLWCEQKVASTELVRQKTGLLLDPYFSASKIHWILQEVPEAYRLSLQGDLCFGTVDSWLIFKLTAGQYHLTDITNASRTLLFNIHEQKWDQTLLSLFNIPESILPTVKPCHAFFGETSLLGTNIPILGVAGDQQASLIGQFGLKKGAVKTTLGTGCFMMANTAHQVVKSEHNLISTIGYNLFDETHFALEGSIFHAGSIINWMRDNLCLFKEINELNQLDYEYLQPLLYFIPAFNGLSAPHWLKKSQAAFIGFEKHHTDKNLLQAGLESIAWQNYDLLMAMEQDGVTPQYLNVDGGISNNLNFLQRLADLTQISIKPAVQAESTALGVMLIAAIELGLIKDKAQLLALKENQHTIKPRMSKALHSQYHQGWLQAIQSISH